MCDFKFNNILLDRITVCFTWDDNFAEHKIFIAPLFLNHNISCTFFINVGDKNFTEEIANNYMYLYKTGFEIGSHSLNHFNLISLNKTDIIRQIKGSLDQMEDIFNHRPTTFAFPYHDYNKYIFDKVKKYFFETRNSLNNSVRIDLHTLTSNLDIVNEITKAIINRYNIVFAGHSIKSLKDNISSGYHPILLDTLDKILNFVKYNREKINILTFEQSALKEYIKKNCRFNQTHCFISNYDQLYLSNFGLTIDKLRKLM